MGSEGRALTPMLYELQKAPETVSVTKADPVLKAAGVWGLPSQTAPQRQVTPILKELYSTYYSIQARGTRGRTGQEHRNPQPPYLSSFSDAILKSHHPSLC